MFKYLIGIFFFNFFFLSFPSERYGKELNVVFFINGSERRLIHPYKRYASLEKTKDSYNLTDRFNSSRKKRYKKEFTQQKLNIFLKDFQRAVNNNNWPDVVSLFFRVKNKKISRYPIIKLLYKTNPFVCYLMNIFSGEIKELGERHCNEITNAVSKMEKSEEEINTLFKNYSLVCFEFATLGCNKNFLNSVQVSSDPKIKEMWQEYLTNNQNIHLIFNNTCHTKLFSLVINHWKKECPKLSYSMDDVINHLYPNRINK